VLKVSGITKQEAVDHPQAVLAALNFHMQGPAPPAQLPTRAAVEQQMAKVRGACGAEGLERGLELGH
jgi:hypothetical protein